MIEALNKKNFDAISLGWSAGFEVDVYQMLHLPPKRSQAATTS